MIDGSVLQSAQRCFEKKSRVEVKMVVRLFYPKSFRKTGFLAFLKAPNFKWAYFASAKLMP